MNRSTLNECALGAAAIAVVRGGIDALTNAGDLASVTIDGKKAKRNAVKTGMTCIFTYPAPGAEAQRVDCKN